MQDLGTWLAPVARHVFSTESWWSRPARRASRDMQMPRRKAVHSYRIRGRAGIIIHGQHVYLVLQGREESEAQYERLVPELLTKRQAEELEARSLSRLIRAWPIMRRSISSTLAAIGSSTEG
jgi:hypothetical protein